MTKVHETDKVIARYGPDVAKIRMDSDGKRLLILKLRGTEYGAFLRLTPAVARKLVAALTPIAEQGKGRK